MNTIGILERLGAAAVLALAVTSGAALAQPAKKGAAANFPVRPIRLVVPVPPGGSSDASARIIGQKLTERWNQQVIIDNRAGAAEIIGTEIIARANPDGYTLVLVSLRYSVNPSLLKLPYDPVRDFDPVTMTAAVGNVLVVNGKTPVKSVKELIAIAKQKPGELTFASSGVGGAPHLIGEFFALETGVKLTHIAYKGGGPAIADLVGGNVFMSFASMTSSLPFIKAGRLRPLAVSSRERSAQLPEVPTMIEAGVPGYQMGTWWGLLAPAGTPRPIIARLSAEVRKALSLPEIQNAFKARSLEYELTTPEQFAARIRDEYDTWGKIVKEANIKSE